MTRSSLKLLSPAKVNLFLRVLRKRPDGYHDIETLFERVGLCDEIVLKKAPSGIRVQTAHQGLPKGRGNLAYRAARLLKDRYGVSGGVRITLRKRIPVAAGLGGGSSNAAAVLVGLNRLWRLRLPRRRLLELGASLGSDVPFFILGVPFALAKGRGETLRRVRGPRSKLWHCLVKPPFRISTRRSYAAFPSRSLTPPRADARMLFRSFKKGDSKHLSRHLSNSLEGVLNNRLKTILDIKKKLMDAGALGCLMSGSGPTVFGLFSTRSQALRAARSFRAQHGKFEVFVTSTF